MDYADNRISLETRDAPLEKVLEQLSRLADVNIVSDGPLEDRVTVYVSDRPTDEAARKILRGQDVSFLYRPSHDAKSADRYRLSEIRIYVPEGGASAKAAAARSRPSQPPSATRSRPRPPPSERAAARTLPDRTPRDAPSYPTDEFMSGLLGGNLNALDEVADQLKEEHPEAAPQINQFLKTLEEAKARAAERGIDADSIEDLGGMSAIMREALRKRRQGQ